MIRNKAALLLFFKTALVTAVAALVVAVQVDAAWGGAYAMAGLFGLFNWMLLGACLIAFTESRLGVALGCFAAKLVLLFTYVAVVIPQTGMVFSAFMLGFNTFLIVAVLEAVGALVLAALDASKSGRPMPKFALTDLRGGRPLDG